MKRTLTGLVAVSLLLSFVPATRAAYIDDIGYTALQAQLGALTPTGAGVRVAQVEAPINDVSGISPPPPIFMPDPSYSEFLGRTITAVGGNPSDNYSGHATTVGTLFYGSSSSIAPGIGTIDVYEANNWINSLYVSTPGPNYGKATTSPDRVTNHSWVGGGADAVGDGAILRLVDRQVALNESIQVVGLTNGPGNSPLLGGSGYNVIAVGRTDGSHQQGSVAVDTVYGAGRTVPTLVAPMGTTSAATPVVSAAAALLVQTGHQNVNLSEGSTTIAGIGTVYNAERSETIKAVLMAGADRETANTSTTADITDYRSAGHETANGLDSRYGAGQVNILNSYHILAGGEQRSQQNGGSDITSHGFDYAGAFGGLNGSARTASYFFDATNHVTLFASLVWNLSVSNDANLTATLHHLSLSLFDVTTNTLVATSSSPLDNTQNLFFHLLLGDRYEMRVTTDEAGTFSLNGVTCQ